MAPRFDSPAHQDESTFPVETHSPMSRVRGSRVAADQPHPDR